MDDDIVYSLGINSLYNDQFFLVNGYDLDVNDPLLSIKTNYLGMGIIDAKANLHVSGNAGVLIQGQLQFFDDIYRQDVIDAFNQPGSQLQFNPYSASFRSGMFFGSENHFTNVGVFSAGTGYSNQVSGNLAAALGGASQRVSGFYSTAMGGASNDILSGFSFSGGRGSYIDHHGSFVFSHSGFLPAGGTSVSQDDRLKTTDSRQFLIGTPQNSFAPAYLGINTNNSYGLATIKARSIVPSVFEEMLSISSSNATILFNALIDEAFIDSDGDLLVYKDRYFTQYFSANDFPIIVSINSVQVYQDLVATLNNDLNQSYWQANTVITSTNLREWALVPTDNWDNLFMPVIDGDSSTPAFNNNANVGIRFHTLFVSNNVFLTAEKFKDALKTPIGIYDDNSSFKQCDDYDLATSFSSTANLIEGIINDKESVFSDELENFTNITTTNVKDFMLEVLDKDGVDCDDWQDLYITIATVNKKIYEKDVNAKDFEDGACAVSDSWQCQYTYYAYSTYLSSTIYSQLFDAIRSNIDRFVFDLDSVASGSYLLSDVDDEFINDISFIGSPAVTSVNVQAVLEKLLTSNILLLEGQNQDAVFRAQNNNSINLGFDEFVNNADFAISGNIAIVEPRVESFISTPSLIKIDNLYDPDFDYSSNQESLYPEVAKSQSFVLSLYVKKL